MQTFLEGSNKTNMPDGSMNCQVGFLSLIDSWHAGEEAMDVDECNIWSLLLRECQWSADLVPKVCIHRESQCLHATRIHVNTGSRRDQRGASKHARHANSKKRATRLGDHGESCASYLGGHWSPSVTLPTQLLPKQTEVSSGTPAECFKDHWGRILNTTTTQMT